MFKRLIAHYPLTAAHATKDNFSDLPHLTTLNHLRPVGSWLEHIGGLPVRQQLTTRKCHFFCQSGKKSFDQDEQRKKTTQKLPKHLERHQGSLEKILGQTPLKNSLGCYWRNISVSIKISTLSLVAGANCPMPKSLRFKLALAEKAAT